MIKTWRRSTFLCLGISKEEAPATIAGVVRVVGVVRAVGVVRVAGAAIAVGVVRVVGVVGTAIAAVVGAAVVALAVALGGTTRAFLLDKMPTIVLGSTLKPVFVRVP